MVLRRQVERDGGELFENTYVLIMKQEVIEELEKFLDVGTGGEVVKI